MTGVSRETIERNNERSFMNSNLDTYISDGTPERVRERYRRLSDLAKKADFGALD